MTKIEQIIKSAAGSEHRFLDLDQDVSRHTKGQIILTAIEINTAHANCDDAAAGEAVARLDRLLSTMWQEDAWYSDPDTKSPLPGLMSLKEAAIRAASEQQKAGLKFSPMGQATALLEAMAEVEGCLPHRQLAVFLGVAASLLNQGMAK